MKKFLAGVSIALLAGLGTPAIASEITPNADFIKAQETSLTVVTPKGDKKFVESKEFSIQKLLDYYNISGSFKYEDGSPVKEGDKVKLNEEKIIYNTSSIAKKDGKIKLELPVKTVETDELFVDEERVKVEGIAGEAMKTTITTIIPGANGEDKTITEDSITVTKKPVQKVVEKGTKARPIEAVEEPIQDIVVSSPNYSSSSSQNLPASTAPAPNPTVGNSIVDTAMQFRGVPYVYGGASPAGFDCSGLTSYVYSMHGISIPRTSYGQASVGTGVSLTNALPGDIVVMNGASHVGIYLGNNQMIHAPRPGKVVEVASLDWFSIDSIRRL